MTPSGDAKPAYIAVATRRFAMDGFHGASLSHLAKDAGVSKQALLHFFKTKEALYAATLTALAERMIQDLIACLHADPTQWLSDYFTTLCQNAFAGPDRHAIGCSCLIGQRSECAKMAVKALFG